MIQILLATVQTSASISSLTGSTQALSIKAEDSCGKSTTSTLSIVIKNQVSNVRWNVTVGIVKLKYLTSYENNFE